MRFILRSVRILSIAAFVLVSSLSLARTASAASILVNSNTSFTVYWLKTSTNPDLSANATFTITNWSAAGFDLTIDEITNTTPVSALNARLTSFGFGLTPDGALTNDVDGAVFMWDEDTFPAFSDVEICAYAGSNCSGGGGGGLAAGQTMAGAMTGHITGNFANGVTFAPIAAKIQTSVGSFEIDGCLVRCEPDTHEIVPAPEPASLLLLGGGLAVIVNRLRRRRAA
jgi:PEP-CTERM motif